MPRLNIKYQAGSGDSGFSHILGKRSGEQTKFIELRKDDPACFIYGDCQEMSLLIDKIRVECGLPLQGHVFSKLWNGLLNAVRGQSPLKSPGLIEQLEYLSTNAYCISGFCFFLGDSPKNVFPDEYLDKLNSLISEYNSRLENAPDFLQGRKHKSIIRLNQLTEIVRKMERHYVTWQYHPEVVRNLYETIARSPEEAAELGQNILYTLAVLNRLSKFLFAAARHENALLGLPEKYWQAKISD